MGRTVVLLALMVTAVLIASGLALAQAVPGGHTVPLQTQLPTGEAIPDEYIVVLEDQPTSAGLEARATDAAQRMASRYAGLKVKQTYGHALVGFAARIPEERLDEVKADPGVLFVSENREVRADFRQVLPEGVDRIEADKSSAMAGNGRGSVGVGIAVLDSGVDRSHPDLNVAADGKDCSGSPSGPFDDPFGHGTHVAGTAAAKDNAFGVVGVAPGAPIYSVRVLDQDGLGTIAGTICGIDWVTAHSRKIEVANMSLGGFGRDDESCGTENRNAEHYAICRSVEEGVTYVASAGNDDRNFRTQGPASYDEVLTVTAMADNDGRPGGDDRFRCYPRRLPASRDDAAAPFSNFTTVGSDDAGHTIAAPGVCVLSTVPGNSYDVFSGTSMASPHVAGTAALYEAARRDPSPRQVMEALRAEAREQPPSYGFEGDPSRPIDRRYYGYLVHTGDF